MSCSMTPLAGDNNLSNSKTERLVACGEEHDKEGLCTPITEGRKTGRTTSYGVNICYLLRTSGIPKNNF
jgi:hypothetical protein